MNAPLKSPMTEPECVREPLLVGGLRQAVQAGQGRFSDRGRRWRRCAGSGSDPLRFAADRCQYVPAEGSWWGDCRRDLADPQKGAQIADVKRYGEARNAPASDSLEVLQATTRNRRNMFEQVVEAMKYNSLEQISHALFDMREEHLRNM